MLRTMPPTVYKKDRQRKMLVKKLLHLGNCKKRIGVIKKNSTHGNTEVLSEALRL